MRDKHQIIEEPCDGKLSRTVLKTNGVGDNLVEFNYYAVFFTDPDGIKLELVHMPQLQE